MTLSVRRSLAALAVGAALVVAGCSGAGPDRAAIVDGQVISETAMQTAMAQVNAMDPQLLTAKLTPTSTLNALIQAPVILTYLDERGVRVSDSVATQDAAKRGIADPADSTLAIVKLASALSTAQTDGSFTQDDVATLTQKLQALEVEANPRYGTYDPQTAQVQLTSPGWVTPLDAAQ